jgi:hypothetical protein
MPVVLTEIEFFNEFSAPLLEMAHAITARSDKQKEVKVSPQKIIFILYYQTPSAKNEDWKNESFKKASLYLQARYKNNEDYKEHICLVNGYTYNNELEKLWSIMKTLGGKSYFIIERVHLLAHSTKWTPSANSYGLGGAIRTANGGFKGKDITISELRAFPALKFTSTGRLIIQACNSGVQKVEYEKEKIILYTRYGPQTYQVDTDRVKVRYACVAEALSVLQPIPVVGQMGYSYFSKKISSYVKIKDGVDEDFYLWAYHRGKNVESLGFGSNKIIPCKSYKKTTHSATGSDSSYI